jgi:dephospho-CoA kinase
MKTWIVTGGAATGKSSFSELLVKIGGDQVRYFSCDEKAKSLWEVPSCVEKVKFLLGNEVLDGSGGLDRVKVREKVFNDPNLRIGLEQIFHPIILGRFRDGKSALGRSWENQGFPCGGASSL